MRWTKALTPAVALAVGLGAGAGAVGLLMNRPAPSVAGPRGSSGMMGGLGGMMGGGVSGGLVPGRQMEALAAKAARTVQVSGSTLTYRSHRVTLVALGAPGNRPGMYWQIDGVNGLDGPTVSVPADSTITVDFADGDPGHPHGFELTTAAPPYGRMAMMEGRLAAPEAFIMPVPPPQGTLWYATSVTFHAPAPGTYYYICPVPGHAQQGMWGKLVVR